MNSALYKYCINKYLRNFISTYCINTKVISILKCVHICAHCAIMVTDVDGHCDVYYDGYFDV